MTDKVLCRYYMHGTCRYGKDCQFSHDMGEMPSMVCKYYLAGHCSYGDKCRYDHKRPEWTKPQAERRAQGHVQPPASTSDAPHSDSTVLGRMQALTLHPDKASKSNPGSGTAQTTDYDYSRDTSAQPSNAWFSHDQAYHNGYYYGHGNEQEYYDPNDYQYGYGTYDSENSDYSWEQHASVSHDENADVGPVGFAKSSEGHDEHVGPAESSAGLCSQYLASGQCAKGSTCRLVHGNLCEICGRYALHPKDADAAEEHRSECQARHDRLAAVRHSQGVECCVCMERVLEKPVAAERKFGLLSCEHAFCLGCIRGWRSHHEGGADTDTALRTCPVCRIPCWFVTPSSVWPANQEDKDRIVAGYKAKLGQVDCRHWNFGANTCPFGTSCFYRHVYSDGRPQEATLRKYGNSEGEVQIMQPVRLSDFIQLSSARRPLRAVR